MSEGHASNLRQCAYCDGCQTVLGGRLYISRIGRGGLVEGVDKSAKKSASRPPRR